MSLRGLETELTDAVGRLKGSVARIGRLATASARRQGEPRAAEGTGIVVDPLGYLVTNDHVVRGAERIVVTLEDHRSLPADLVGEDPATDLAVVRVPVRDLAPATLADSDRLKVGQFALAMGNPLGLPGGPSVSLGVISALGRPMLGEDGLDDGLIQTDAAINPGNSGGPLADLDGAVMGMNTAIVPFAQGVGFAIPSNTIRSVFDAIRENGRVVRPWLGITGGSVDAESADAWKLPRSDGVYVASVHPEGPGSLAGLRPGDVVIRIGSYPVRSLRDLRRALGRHPIGGAVDLEFDRGGSSRRGVLRIEETPASLAAA
ncbi:MAG TPA: trypsin-like peptidase domain-containing protein [Thermoplasmata archaeon]|nr:trypsin-like peptidase domain-containing protein [Thermoplasmata archaeon]